MRSGIVSGLFITAIAGAPLSAVESVRAVAQRGFVRDRYYLRTGYYSNHHGWGANVTLIESEAIAAINAGHTTDFTAAMLRRNIVTAGVQLESLIGWEFRCGGAVLRGTKRYPPCTHLAELVDDSGILRYLAYCGGIGAEVVADGRIQIGDAIDF